MKGQNNLNPLISVIMPVHNGSEFLNEVIPSIINQTYTNFELLIFDDCSSDNSIEIIENFKDKRIKLFKGEKNIGYVKGLNFLIRHSEGEFIARNDQDDISLPLRFEMQIKTLVNNPDVGVCGTQIETFGKYSKKISYPVKDSDIKAMLIFNVGFHHPTIIFRKKLCDDFDINFYEEKYLPSEDYKLWTVLAKRTNFINTNIILLKYRIHSSNFSSLKIENQKLNNLKIREHYLKTFLGLSLNENQNFLINKIIYNESISFKDLKSIRLLFYEIYNLSNDIKEKRSIKATLSFFWMKACFLNFKNFKHFSLLFLFLNFKLFSIELFLKKYYLKKIL